MNSIIAAVISFYQGLSFPGKPADLWFGQAPLRRPGGGVVDLPILEFFHEGTPNDTTFNAAAIKTYNFRFESYADTIGGAEQVYYGVLYNNAAPDLTQGFEQSTSIPLPTGFLLVQCRTIGDMLIDQIITQRDDEARIVYRCTWRMTLVVNYVG